MGGFYAADNQITKSPIQGGIEITEQQYHDALEGMLAGERVRVVNGTMIVEAVPEPEPEPEPAPPAPSTRLLLLTIQSRMTPEEKRRVAGFSSGTDEEVAWWLQWVSSPGSLDTADPEIVTAFEAVFGEERAAELLAAED